MHIITSLISTTLTKGNEMITRMRSLKMQGYVNEMYCFTLYVAACSINNIAMWCVNNARYLFPNNKYRVANDISSRQGLVEAK